MITRFVLAAVGILFVAVLCTAEDKPKEPVVLKRVPKIVRIEYELQTSEPPNLIVTAHGQVPTGGWSNVQLIRRIYETEPADGIWEYDLIGSPPDGPTTQVITDVKANDVWEKLDPKKKLKGLRVYGLEKGIKTVMFK